MVTKKSGLIIIVVLLVLGTLTEAANEPVGTWEIGTRYIDGTAFEPDTDMLDIGDSLYLSIYTEEAFGWASTFGYYWALVCEASLAGITGGEAGADATEGSIFYFYGSASDLWEVPGSVPEHEDGQYGVIGNDDPAPGVFLEPGVWLDNFLYSPMAVGDVTVRFLEISSVDGTIGRVPDSIVIYQVPEPMTIILVGLGGLFVFRRR